MSVRGKIQLVYFSSVRVFLVNERSLPAIYSMIWPYETAVGCACTGLVGEATTPSLPIVVVVVVAGLSEGATECIEVEARLN